MHFKTKTKTFHGALIDVVGATTDTTDRQQQHHCFLNITCTRNYKMASRLTLSHPDNVN